MTDPTDELARKAVEAQKAEQERGFIFTRPDQVYPDSMETYNNFRAFATPAAWLERSARIQALEAELLKSNDALRSTYQVCLRDGKGTNWTAFIDMVKDALNTAHVILKPIREDAARALSSNEGDGNAGG